MPSVTLPDGLTIAYETTGSPADPVILLVAGLGSQLISWDDGFCSMLSDAGRYVVRFDNRDAGLSTSVGGDPVDLGAVMRAASSGDLAAARALVPYTLNDMAADAVGLLDALDIDRAHVVGASMGGMIAQAMAIEHPGRVRTLTSIMSTTGEPGYGRSSPEARQVLLSPAPTDRDAFIEDSVRRWCGTRGATATSTRCGPTPPGPTTGVPPGGDGPAAGGHHRQWLPCRGPGRPLTVPTLVIHGLDRRLTSREPSGGERTAELVPGARLLLVPDMGHDRPEPPLAGPRGGDRLPHRGLTRPAGHGPRTPAGPVALQPSDRATSPQVLSW